MGPIFFYTSTKKPLKKYGNCFLSPKMLILLSLYSNVINFPLPCPMIKIIKGSWKKTKLYRHEMGYISDYLATSNRGLRLVSGPHL